MNHKPSNYNALSPYLVVEDAPKFLAFLAAVFHAEPLRRFERPDGKIAHAEMRLDDSVIMVSSSNEGFAAKASMLHYYVPNVFEVYDRAIAYGCTSVREPEHMPGDPDTRGHFYDPEGNFWSVSTQGEVVR